MTERPTNGAPEDARHARGPSRAELIEKLEDMQRVLDETREQSDEHLRGMQRAAADFANYRRRVDEEREGLSQFTNALLISKVLGVLDDFDRALETVPPGTNEGVGRRRAPRRAKAARPAGGRGSHGDRGARPAI